MFENVPIHKRWKFILAGIGGVFIVSLLYARQVWGIYASIDELARKTAIIEDADLEIVNRQVRLKELSDRISRLQATSHPITSHVALMQYIEQQCDHHQVRIIQLPRETLENIQGYEVAHVDFSVQGTFHHILHLLYHIEAQDRIGSIAKAHMELKTMRVADDRQQLLIATIRINRLIQKQPGHSQSPAAHHSTPFHVPTASPTSHHPAQS